MTFTKARVAKMMLCEEFVLSFHVIITILHLQGVHPFSVLEHVSKNRIKQDLKE